jgi:hypothetical protein
MTFLNPNQLRFDTERELQLYLIRVLRSKGISAREEVQNGAVRADIVTPRAVIEVKKVLDRQAIYQALGQATIYQQNLGSKEIWIVGQSPYSPTEKQQAYSIACEAEKMPGVRVSFVDEDDFWLEGSGNLWSHQTLRWLWLVLGVSLLLWSFQNWSRCPAPAMSRDPPIPEQANQESAGSTGK